MTTDTLEALREAREIWIVGASSGEWSDRHEWNISAHLSEQEAKDEVVRLTVLARTLAARQPNTDDSTWEDDCPIYQTYKAWQKEVDDAGLGNEPEDTRFFASPVPLSRIDAALASDHIGNSTTMVPALGVEGVARTIAEADGVTWTKDRVNYRSVGHADEGPVAKYYRQARAFIAAMGKQDGATLGVAQIKATIWKHWRNQNGQTLEDRFTSAAEEIAAMEKNDG